MDASPSSMEGMSSPGSPSVTSRRERHGTPGCPRPITATPRPSTSFASRASRSSRLVGAERDDGSQVARMGVAPEDTQRVAPGRVGAFTAVCLLVSNAVGSGIFTTTGFLARDLGDARLVLGLWVVGGLLALAGALSYSEPGAWLPRAGG